MKFLAQFSRFLVIGGLATAIQYGVLIALVQLLDFDPVIASATGFVISALANYALNRRYTFRSSQGHQTAAPRFAIVATSGLLLNTLLMWVIGTMLKQHYLLAQILATGAVLAWNFWLHRHWTFSTPHQ